VPTVTDAVFVTLQGLPKHPCARPAVTPPNSSASVRPDNLEIVRIGFLCVELVRRTAEMLTAEKRPQDWIFP
jgi:hypothetical protein